MTSAKRIITTFLSGLMVLGAGAAHAQETTTYTYDARGRIIASSRSGGPVSGTNTSYAYDPADNRTQVIVSNSPNGSSSDPVSGATVQTKRYVVVPLNGYTLIQISG